MNVSSFLIAFRSTRYFGIGILLSLIRTISSVPPARGFASPACLSRKANASSRVFGLYISNLAMAHSPHEAYILLSDEGNK